MKVLVTGGAGFIGSHLAEGLLSRGIEVNVIDNLSSGNLRNLEDCRENSSFRFFEGDIRNQEDIEEASVDVEAIFHEAAVTSVPASFEDPETTEEVNLGGTLNLLKASVESDIERFIFASSCSVYGETEYLPIKEDFRPNPKSPYAETKLSAERVCRQYNGEEGLETVILRYFNVFGPRQGSGEYATVISKFLENLGNNARPTIYGDGEQTRDFIYIGDVVRANLLAFEEEGISGDVFNVGRGEEVTINRLFETIKGIFGGSNLDPVYKERRSGDIRRSRADLTKAERKLGFSPKVSLKEGLEKTIEEN